MRALSAILLLPVVALAQQSPRGHWSGIIRIPDHPVSAEIDLDQAAGMWIGSISMPEEDIRDAELTDIAFVPPGKWMFRVKRVAGAPAFTGSLSTDGKTMAGEFTRGDRTNPFQLIRAGDAQVATPRSSPAVTGSFAGTWRGQLGPSLRLTLKLANDESGAKGVLINMEQGDSEIPITAVEQDGSRVDLEIHMIGVEYRGEINKEGTVITGRWIQAGRPMPLSFRKIPRE